MSVVGLATWTQLAQLASAVFGLLAAGFWFWSTVIPTSFKAKAFTGGHVANPGLVELRHSLVRQSRLNALGAGCAAIAPYPG